MASINIMTFQLSHSCAFSSLTAEMRRGRSGHRETERTTIKLHITTVVHKKNTKLCMCILQMTVKDDLADSLVTHAGFSLIASCLLTVKLSVWSHVARQTGQWLLAGCVCGGGFAL